MTDPKKQVNVVAVIVTYNRFELLVEAVTALHHQTVPLQNILVVNNGSTDDTARWLDEQSNLVVIHQHNVGASGGFATGIREAAKLGADYIWLMDDDTICSMTALEQMLEKMKLIKEPIGFISSRCNWMDSTPHLMNIPAIKPMFNNGIPFNKYDQLGLILVESSSFVSLLVNVDAIKKVGLPYKEFFIWGDDQEFTRRITKQGYAGFYCIDSIVLHKTAINYFADFYHDTLSNVWKHRHGFRNEFFMVKQNKGFLYFICWLPAKVAYASIKVLRIRKNNRFKFLRVLFSAAWESIFFNPAIETIPNPFPSQPSSRP